VGTVVDLLAHVLVAYTTGAVLAWRGRLAPAWVPVLMVGAVLPDLAKAGQVVSPAEVAALVGVRFQWLVLHRLGGVLLVAGLGALLFESGRRRTAWLVLVAGAVEHLLLDVGVVRAGGVAPPYLYPLSWWQPPSAGLYLSSDLWPLALATALAAGAWALTTGRVPGVDGRPEGTRRTGDDRRGDGRRGE